MSTTSRGVAPTPTFAAGPEDKPRAALALMVQALDLIDASQGTGVAGAHLDLAIHRLREWIDGEAPK
jgi:hypothetical protein